MNQILRVGLAGTGVLVLALLSTACSEEAVPPPATTEIAPVSQATTADQHHAEVTVSVAEVLAELPSGHPRLEGLSIEEDPLYLPSAHTITPRNEPTVVVPEGVRERWKSMTLAIHQPGKTVREVRVAPGERLTIDEENRIQIEIGAFLPAYMSDFEQATSEGNELDNPALQVMLWRDEVLLDKGWLFRDYPDFNTLTTDVARLRLLAAHESR